MLTRDPLFELRAFVIRKYQSIRRSKNDSADSIKTTIDLISDAYGIAADSARPVLMALLEQNLDANKRLSGIHKAFDLSR